MYKLAKFQDDCSEKLEKLLWNVCIMKIDEGILSLNTVTNFFNTV